MTDQQTQTTVENALDTAGELRYAAHLTTADVDNALNFLRPRIEVHAYGKGDTPESRIALGLLRMVNETAADARFALQLLAEDNFHTDSHQLESQHGLCRAWRRLHEALCPWQDDEGYDTARWRRAYYYDARHEATARKVSEQIRAGRAARQAGAEEA